MPITNYPFKNAGNSVPRPYLWILITNPIAKISIRALALIDTGADDCCFPASAAAGLKFNLKSGACKEVRTANGKTNAYQHKCTINVLQMLPDGRPGQKEVYTMHDVEIDFVENCQAFLLGSRNFLAKFKLTIDYPRQKFSLQLPV